MEYTAEFKVVLHGDEPREITPERAKNATGGLEKFLNLVADPTQGERFVVTLVSIEQALEV